MAAPRSDLSPGAGASGALHEAILETLASAVISMRPDGVIITFNAAAGGITGLAPESVIGRTFAEVFVPMEGAEDFTQAVLDSVYQGPLIRRRLIEAAFDAGIRSLSVSVSRIVAGKDEDAGLAVVFDDISEIRELREKEISLAREVDAQHRKLREAYLGLEESNRILAEANRQARRARAGGLGAVVVLLTVFGLYAMDFRSPGTGAAERPSEPGGGNSVVITVEPRELSRTVLVEGRLAPRREVDVTSPMTGKVAAVHVPHGARVEQGQLLLELDVTEARIAHRAAEADHIRALERFNEAENWANGVEVSRARRSVARARLDLADSSAKVEETAFLLGRGVIPSSEHDAAQRGFNNRQLDLEAAEQDLASILNQGTADARVARLDLANARARLNELGETLRLAALRAPVGGIVMRPPRSEGSGENRERLGAGDSVAQGERLLIIGDLSGISVVGRVDEVDVVEIKPGNDVLVKGDAFRGTVLRGVVERVSSEAIVEPRALPFFEVTAVVENLMPDQRAALRIGMSAILEVRVRHEPRAVLLPLDAVTLADGQATVLMARGGGFQPVPVAVGESTIDSVEIIKGIVPGDRVLVPQPQ